MDPHELLYFRNLLLARLQESLSAVREVVLSLEDSRDCSEPMDLVDLTSNLSAQEFTLILHSRTRQVALEIRGALNRITIGTFGICEECGSDISLQRLKAQPTATLCIDCKRGFEMQGRLEVA